MCKQGSVISMGMFCLNIKRRNVIEMTVWVHTINGVIRRKNLHVFKIITSYQLKELMITKDDLNIFSNEHFCLFRENCCLFWGPGDYLNEQGFH